MITTILELISSLSFLFLIIGGIFSSLYFIERVSGVISEDLQEWVKYIAYFGFVIGILVLINAASNLVLPHIDSQTVSTGKEVGWDVTVLGLVLGVTLCLRPIKDYRWAAILTLTIGVLSMILIWFLAPSSVNEILIVAMLVFLFVFYMSLKFIEDIYTLLGDILTSPPLVLGIGVLAIIQGILLFFGTSILGIIGL
ncbi:MAG: hypothetical protein HeimC3_11830 [Candidatus Heimdallarchaeota archaeon LC_3]|nr:MAG: hypothetical protein HeimC3_11830 [Candidatus Heimdallarchaeota archaeon LC_3]